MRRASGHGVAQAESDTCPIPDTPGTGLNLPREVPRSPHRCKIEHGGLRNRVRAGSTGGRDCVGVQVDLPWQPRMCMRMCMRGRVPADQVEEARASELHILMYVCVYVCVCVFILYR
jgi:hypothetical protein